MAELNIGGLDWVAIQSNGWTATFDLVQDATGKISGDVRAGHPVEVAFSGTVDMSQSKVVGESVLIRVEWHNGSVGVYSGNLNLQRKLTGITFDETHTSSQATWFSNKSF